MKIIETKVMRGPNQWSVEEKQLIVMKVEVDRLTEDETDEFRKKFSQELKFIRKKPDLEFSSSSVLIESALKLIVYLQEETGIKVHYARSKEGHNKGEFFLVFSYDVEQVAVEAGEMAVEIIQDLLDNIHFDINKLIDVLIGMRSRYSIGPTTTYILNEVKKRKIPFKQFNYSSLIMLGHGNRQKKIRTAVTDSTSGLGMEMAGDKEETKALLADSNLPVPKGILVYDEEELLSRLHEVRFPVVIKPLDGNHGRGVTTDINSEEKALFGFDIAKKISDTVIVEEFVKGDDYRFLVINFKLVAATHRMPAYVIGDGSSSVQELIDKENKHPDRGDTSDHVLALIKVDAVTKKILADKKLSLDSVIPKGQRLILKDTANISAGGTAEDVTDTLHPDNRFMAERVARMFNLDICGIDIVTTAVDIPITRDVGAIIEVNAGPGLRMHSNPQKGPSRDVAGPIIDMLFPTPAAAEIPIVAITGTNGKTTTARLMAHMAKTAGYTPGMCNSSGIFIDGHQTYEGDCGGYVSAQQVLFDASVDFAVLEVARGSIIRAGLGFESCDVSILTNIAEDHLGMKDIYDLDDLLRVKSVVARSTKKTGVAILNADDNRVYSLYEELDCKIGLFALDGNNDRIREHIKNNGMAAYVENGNIVVVNGYKIVIESLDNIPLTYDGKADFMIRNVLAAVLGAIACGVESATIKKSLQNFEPSPDINPGRLNMFDFGDFKVMVDYVHNVDGFTEIKKFLSKIENKPKTAIISIAGDRREDDIRAVGMIAATTFDKIIIRHDKSPRDRSGREVESLLTEGVLQVNSKIPITAIPKENDAILHAINNAEKNSFIFICADNINETLQFVSEIQSEHMNLIHH